MISKIYEKLKQFIKENYKGLIVLILIILLFTIELPYSIYTPGGSINLNDRINIKDEYDTKGSFNMAYVSMMKGNIPFIILSKFIPNWDAIKKEDITIPGENIKDMMDRERLQLEESMNAATILAYKSAGAKITINNVENNVSFISNEAKTDLKIGDQLKKIDDQEINSLDDLINYVSNLDINTKVKLLVIRDGKEKVCSALTYEVDGKSKIGVSLITTYDYDASPKLNIKTKSSEMGSSGGLMMSLTIYNKLVKEDITKGKKIVGTGTIDIDGNVGEIGGVKYKLIGAVKNKADVFICPKENYEEAKKVAKDHNFDIKIISVSTFEETLKKLESLNF